MVQNYMEGLVAKTLDKELDTSPEKYADMCLCAACRAHIMVVALNALTPFYVTGMAGEVYGEYKHKELQYQSDVLVAVGKGIEAVRLAGHGMPPAQ